jgi:hypothetical protein
VCFAAIRCCPHCCPGIESVADSTASSRRRNNGTGQSSRNGNDDRRSNVTFVPLVTSSPARRIDDAPRPATRDSNTADAKPDVASDPLKHRNATVAVLDDGTERHGTGCASVAASGGVAVVTNRASTNAGTTNETYSASGSLLPQSSSSRQQHRPQVLRAGERTVAGNRSASYAMATSGNGRPKLFQLLIAIVLLTTVVLSGLLSDVLAHANYPTGSWTFAVGAAGCDIVSAAACIVAARANARSEMSTVIAMTCLGTIVLTYFGALVAFGQHVGVARSGTGFGRSAGLPGGTVDTALLMGSTGEYLAVSISQIMILTHGHISMGTRTRTRSRVAISSSSILRLEPTQFDRHP